MIRLKHRYIKPINYHLEKLSALKCFFAKQDGHEATWTLVPLPHYRTLLNISRTIPNKQQNILNDIQAPIENTKPFTIDFPLHRTPLLLSCQSTSRAQIHTFHSKKNPRYLFGNEGLKSLNWQPKLSVNYFI